MDRWHRSIKKLAVCREVWRGKNVRTLLLILTCFFIIITLGKLYSESPSHKLERRISELQRHGSCVELPRFGVSTHRRRNPDDVNVRLVTAVGARIVRFDIPWSDVEKEGKFDFKEFDYIVQQLREKGKSILLLLAYGHPDHTDESWATSLAPRTQQQREAYFRYVRAVVEHFHGPDIAYEIWNEPNIWQFWPFTAKAYGALLDGAARAIREIAPKAKIVAAGIANGKNRDSFVREMIANANLEQVDALAFHPYRKDGPENSLLDISEFEDASAMNGQNHPVWLTEWGYSESWLGQDHAQEYSRQRQAIMIARIMLTAALSKARAAIIYDLIDDGPDASDPEFKFGLYDYEFQPKKAALAFRTLTNLISNCNTYNFEFDPTQKLITATFKDTLHISYVIWTFGRRRQDVCFLPDSSKGIRLVDLFEKQLPIASCQGSSNIKLVLSENSGPIILTTDR
jgi:hypothetical protein